MLESGTDIVHKLVIKNFVDGKTHNYINKNLVIMRLVMVMNNRWCIVIVDNETILRLVRSK